MSCNKGFLNQDKKWVLDAIKILQDVNLEVVTCKKPYHQVLHWLYQNSKDRASETFSSLPTACPPPT